MNSRRRKTERNISVRSYRPGDEHLIIALFKEAFGRDLSLPYWTWRFQDNPVYEIIANLACDGDRPVSHYCVSPTRMSVFGKEYLTGLSISTMTHPDYRGCGLFARLAEDLYHQMKEKGMLMVWGFPNRLIHRPRVNDLSWSDIYEIPTFFKILSEGRRMPEPSSAVCYLNGFDSSFDTLWDKIKSSNRIITVRSSAYLDWRYKRNPVNDYTIFGYKEDERLRGYAVCKQFMHDVDLVDILCDNDTVGGELMSAVLQWAEQKRANRVNMWLNVHLPLHRELEKHGFINGEPVTYVGARLLAPGLDVKGIYNFRNWYLTMGDSDVY
jgi:GNAT superfamily N-acetyltransferase